VSDTKGPYNGLLLSWQKEWTGSLLQEIGDICRLAGRKKFFIRRRPAMCVCGRCKKEEGQP